MKTILFTGARSGIINQVIDTIINDYQIYVTVEDNKQLERVLEKYKNYDNVKCLKLDVTNKEDYKKIENLDIDIFVSNAAIGMGGSICEIPIERVRENFEVNVFSNFELLQQVIKPMIKKNNGKIIIMSSLASRTPLPFLGSYCSTKASISMLTSCLREELYLLNSNVTVKLIEPGLYNTGFNKYMIENKYDFMDRDTFFKTILDDLKKDENVLLCTFEKKKMDSITKKIVKAINDDNNKFIYSAPFLQYIGAKVIQVIK